MNERIRGILTLLIKQPDTKVTDVAAHLHLSRRQINYALNQFNDELQSAHLPAIIRSHSGSVTIPLEVLQLLANQQVDKEEPKLPILSENERPILLLLMLITNTEYVSLNHFTDFLKVGKNTVTEDIKRAEWLAEKYELKIGYERVKGYQIAGSEHRILQLLSDSVKQYQITQQESVREVLAVATSEEEVLHFIHEAEQLLHVSYSDEAIDYLQTSIRYLVTRGNCEELQQKNFFENQVRKTPEFKVLSSLLFDTEWQLSPSYVEWLTLLFLTSNIFEKKTTQLYDSDIPLRQLIRQMVDDFQVQTFISIDDREAFERRILSHLRPACFRIKYQLSLGVYSSVSLSQDSNHAILVELMNELIRPIEAWLGQLFPQDELDLLSYYFGFQLTQRSGPAHQRYRAVVVCTNGVMVAKLMRENLKKLFPELHFLASFSVRDFYQFEVDYDVVFTTVPLKTDLPQFIINPILSSKEQISLCYRVMKELGLNQVDQSVNGLIKVIQKSASIHHLGNLRSDLRDFLITEKETAPLENFQILPSLAYFLKPSYVQKVTEQLTWQEALKIACRPLLEAQVINEEFYLDCERQISTPDYYGFFGSQVSIPHTTVEHGVLKDGVGFLVSKEPILFPGGQKIHFIVPLAFHDLTRHLRAVNQIAAISSKQELLQQFLQQADQEMIFQILRHNS